MSDVIEIPAGDYTIRIRARRDYEPNPAPRVYVADEIAEARSTELAQLAATEKNLGAKRFSERGTDVEVDALYNRLNAAVMEVKTTIAQDVLVLLAADVSGDVDAAVERAFFSRHAGCETCTCSPGVVAGKKLTWQGGEFDVWVEVPA